MAKKEEFEWIRHWADHAPKNDLPRVLLVGDSITQGYNEPVREMLLGECYVDYVATSYPIDSKLYHDLVLNMVKDNKFAAVHFNHGLHGWHNATEDYKAGMKALMMKISETAKVIAVTSTPVRVVKSNETAEINNTVLERNKAVLEIAEECGFAVDDLYPAARALDGDDITGDGYHYSAEGYKKLAATVVASIKANI